MENIFTTVIDKEENTKREQISKNKSKVERILKDLQAILPIDTIEKPGYTAIHFGKKGNPYNCVSQTKICYNSNSIYFSGLLLIQHPDIILFKTFTYGDLISQYEDNQSYSKQSSNQYSIKIDLESAANLEVLYWVVKKIILEIRN